MQPKSIDELRIASPCPVGWEQMSGDDRVRFCNLCSLHVYNLAEMSRADAESLITKSEGRICARLFRRADGTVTTKDCPAGLRAFRRRVARIAGAVFATIIGLCGGAFGQKEKDDKACRQQLQITRSMPVTATATSIEVFVLDPAGAALPGVKIAIVDRKTRKSYELNTDDNGRSIVTALPAGKYGITITLAGFEKVQKDLSLAAKETVNLEVALIPNSMSVTVGIILGDTLIDTSRPGGTIILSEEMLRRLPVPRN